MYGYVGAYAGFTPDDLKEGASGTKRRWGMTVDEYDEVAYRLGWDLYKRLSTASAPATSPARSFCTAFKELVGNGQALREGTEGDGYNDLSSCTPCTEKTKETRHGGREGTRMRP